MKSKEQSFWTTFVIVMLVLIGGSGFYCFQSYSKFSTADKDFDMLRHKAQKLIAGAEIPNQRDERISPTTENVEALKVQVGEFETEVKGLHEALKKFQQPLEPVRDQEFPRIVKEYVEKFTARTTEANRLVKLPDPFYLGMDAYQSTIPPREAASILKFQLDSIDHLLRLTVDNGADVIYALSRDTTPQEAGQDDPEKTELVTKYPITFSFRTTHDGFRQFVNLVSNDGEFFYIIRVLRVDNETKEGPSKQVDQESVIVNREGEVVVDPSSVEDQDELEVQDAFVIFGNEKLDVTAVIDLCRFPSKDAPPAEASDAPADS